MISRVGEGNNLLVAGSTAAADFPVTSGVVQATNPQSSTVGFLSEIDPNRARHLFHTLGWDEHGFRHRRRRHWRYLCRRCIHFCRHLHPRRDRQIRQHHPNPKLDPHGAVEVVCLTVAVAKPWPTDKEIHKRRKRTRYLGCPGMQLPRSKACQFSHGQRTMAWAFIAQRWPSGCRDPSRSVSRRRYPCS